MIHRLILVAALALLAKPAVAGGPDGLVPLGADQLGAVTGGQSIVSNNQGSAIIAAESAGPPDATFSFVPQPPPVGMPSMTAADQATAASSGGLMPVMGSLAGSSSFTRYGN